MADYDVGVVALTTPAATAPLAACRPAVSVRNNGLHDAVASGYIRVYSAGLKVFESELYSDTIAPGQTRPASAVDYWTPSAEGTYIVAGYVSCPLDQVEPNNNLSPTSIEIRADATPPPDTPVPIHASQHESDGADELSIEGLSGRARDGQTPIAHASNHQVAGTDPLDVSNLNGQLAEPQHPSFHAYSHKLGGSDSLDVHSLPNATDLELVSRKGQASGYAELDISSAVPVVRLAPVTPSGDGEYRLRFVQPSGARDWVEHVAAASITSAIEGLHHFVPGMGLSELIRLELTAAQAKPGTAGIFDFTGEILAAAGGGQSVDIALLTRTPAL